MNKTNRSRVTLKACPRFTLYALLGDSSSVYRYKVTESELSRHMKMSFNTNNIFKTSDLFYPE